MQPTTTTKTNLNQIAEELAHFLADTYALYVKTQNFHWNVTGPHFPALHKLFEEQYNQLAAAVDVIAERIRTLGSIAPGSFSEFQRLTSIKDENGNLSAEKMIQKLLDDHEALIKHSKIIFSKAEKLNDQTTMDMLIDRWSEHEKIVWMLKSSL